MENKVMIDGIDALLNRRCVTICCIVWSIFVIDQGGLVLAKARLRRWIRTQYDFDDTKALLFVLSCLVKPELESVFQSIES
jgi:hypothetical protein